MNFENKENTTATFTKVLITIIAIVLLGLLLGACSSSPEPESMRTKSIVVTYKVTAMQSMCVTANTWADAFVDVTENDQAAKFDCTQAEGTITVSKGDDIKMTVANNADYKAVKGITFVYVIVQDGVSTTTTADFTGIHYIVK